MTKNELKSTYAGTASRQTRKLITPTKQKNSADAEKFPANISSLSVCLLEQNGSEIIAVDLILRQSGKSQLA